MENETLLTEEEYNELSKSLSLGLTFTKFGNATLDIINLHCKQLNLDPSEIIDVQDAYARHPKNFTSVASVHQGK